MFYRVCGLHIWNGKYMHYKGAFCYANCKLDHQIQLQSLQIGAMRHYNFTVRFLRNVFLKHLISGIPIDYGSQCGESVSSVIRI